MMLVLREHRGGKQTSEEERGEYQSNATENDHLSPRT